ESALAPDLEPDQATPVGAFDHRVIEGERMLPVRSRAVQHRALLDIKLALQHGHKMLPDRIGRIGGKEAKLTLIDAKNRHARTHGFRRGGEDGAIPPQYAAGVRAFEIPFGYGIVTTATRLHPVL